MANGAGYITYGKNVNKAAELFAEKILSPLQEALKAENNETLKCLRDRRKGCNQCHDCDIEVLNPNY